MEEFRIIGPPGTGKTTWVAKHVRSAIEAGGKSSVVVASLTKAAAREIGGRDLGVEKEQVGTLHAHAWRALGRPPVATGKALKPWNEAHPKAALSTATADRAFDDGVDTNLSRGEALMLEYSSLRSRMVPRESWKETLKKFATDWEEWKRESGLIDFTDMIEHALHVVDTAPGRPRYIFCDEAQDMDRLQLALVRKWASHAERLLIVGDPYQNLYEWRGTDARSFFDPHVDDAHMRVLKNSWRVPRTVHKAAMAWIGRHPRYEHFDYQPRDADGQVASLWAPSKYPGPIIRDLKKHLDEGRSIMILASCGYILGSTLAALRAEGIPFHNPYRPRRGDWNQLRKKDRIMAYLATDSGKLWTWGQLWKWAEIVSADNLIRRGMKTAIEERARKDKDLTVEPVELQEIFEPDGCRVGDLDWLRSKLLNTAPKTLRYLIEVALRRGKATLEEEPRVVVGTIHSVKGGEADVVYLFPDLSRQATESWIRRGSVGYGAIVRQFYVGMTRARERLVLCQPASPMSVRINA